VKFLLALLLISCQVTASAPISAPLSPTDARASTFRVDTADGTGTAWVVANETAGSHLVTAGHMCRNPLTDYTLVGYDGKTYTAQLERVSATHDLCLLATDGAVGPALSISPLDPIYDEPVMAVGAPNGVYGCDSGATIARCGMAPISRGWYAGGTLVSMPMVGGNSGSAVFTSGGVIGVLVEGYRGFDSLSFIEPRDHLLEFLAQH
jgi:hypothetical protein